MIIAGFIAFVSGCLSGRNQGVVEKLFFDPKADRVSSYIL